MLHHSTKFDGSLHYRFPTTIVHQSESLLAIHRGPGVAMDSYRGVQISKLHVLHLFWPDRHWNLSVGWYQDWVAREHYANIATPADWSDGTLRWIDLDLDVIWRIDDAAARSPQPPRLDDEDEFDLHRQRFAYPDTLVQQCRRTAEQVKTSMMRGEGLFDGRLLDWRLGRPLPPLQMGPSLGR